MAAPKKNKPAHQAAGDPAAGPDAKGAGTETKEAFRKVLEAKQARDAERSGEDHLSDGGMNLHPNDKQQRQFRRKSG